MIRDLSKNDCVIREGEKVQICWLTCDLNNSDITARDEIVGI